jgi:hypothetical protein
MASRAFNACEPQQLQRRRRCKMQSLGMAIAYWLMLGPWGRPTLQRIG